MAIGKMPFWQNSQNLTPVKYLKKESLRKSKIFFENVLIKTRQVVFVD